MSYMRTRHLFLSLTTFLTCAPLMANPWKEMAFLQEQNKITVRVTVDDDVATRTLAAYAHCCKQGDEEGALTLYEASDSLFNTHEYELLTIWLRTFTLNAIERCERTPRAKLMLYITKLFLPGSSHQSLRIQHSCAWRAASPMPALIMRTSLN